jgi:hypothetical protein
MATCFQKREYEDECDCGTRARRELARLGRRGVSPDECRPGVPALLLCGYADFRCKAGILLRSLTNTRDVRLHAVRESGPSVIGVQFRRTSCLTYIARSTTECVLVEQFGKTEFVGVAHFAFAVGPNPLRVLEAKGIADQVPEVGIGADLFLGSHLFSDPRLGHPLTVVNGTKDPLRNELSAHS